MKICDEINTVLFEMMQNNREVILIGEDILDPYGGAFRITKGLSSSFPERVLTTPISEATIAGMSIGMALRGLYPIAEIMFGDFITLCMDQLLNHASKLKPMYNGNVVVPMIMRTPMGGGRGYGPTHSQSLEKHFLGIPFIDIVAVSLFHNVKKIFLNAYNRRRPVIIIENKLLYPMELFISSNDEVFIENMLTETGYCDVIIKNYINNTPDILIVTYGGVSRFLKTILRKMIEEEIRVVSVIIGQISPISRKSISLINTYANQCGKVLILEEGSKEFGWSAEIQGIIENRDIIINRLGSVNTIIPSNKKLEEQVLINEEKIINNILEMIRI